MAATESSVPMSKELSCEEQLLVKKLRKNSLSHLERAKLL